VVADGHTMRSMWRRGWPKANTESAVKAHDSVVESAVEFEADVCIAEIPPAFFMEESDFKPISHLYTEVFRDGNGVEKKFELNKYSYYRGITIDMNKILKKLLEDRDNRVEDTANRIFVTIKKGQSQQFFVRSDYWKKKSNYLGNYTYVNQSFRVFMDYRSGMHPRGMKGVGKYIPTDKCNIHTYYREVPYHLRYSEEEDINNCIDSICTLSGGKSKHRKSKHRKSKCRKSNNRKSRKNNRKSINKSQ
jgi:hypothetical protein